MTRLILIVLFSSVVFLIGFSVFSKELELIGDNLESFSNSSSVIPLNIFQTWKTKNLPPKMKECVANLRFANPEFHYTLMDDDECEDFIEENFPDEVAIAYRQLIPGAYKADLWRYCILYTYGGIYLDIKFHNVSSHKLIELTDKEYFVKDLDKSGGGVYNAFMVCKKGNPILKKCIDAIVENVKNRFYGTDCLEPTGPKLMKRFFTKEEIESFELKLYPNLVIVRAREPIIVSYPEYRKEQTIHHKNIKKPDYCTLWRMKEIYV